MKLRMVAACGVVVVAVIAGIGWWHVRSERTVKVQDACVDRELAEAAEESVKAFSASVDDYAATVAELEWSTAQLEVHSDAIRKKLFQGESDKFRSELVRKWLKR